MLSRSAGIPVLFSARTTDLRAYTTNNLSEKEPKRTGSGAKKRAERDKKKQNAFSRAGSPHLFRVAERKRPKKNREGVSLSGRVWKSGISAFI